MLRYPYRKRHKRSIQLCESPTLVIKTALLSEFRAKCEEKSGKKDFLWKHRSTSYHLSDSDAKFTKRILCAVGSSFDTNCVKTSEHNNLEKRFHSIVSRYNVAGEPPQIMLLISSLKTTADETLFLELTLHGYDRSKLRDDETAAEIFKIECAIWENITHYEKFELASQYLRQFIQV